MWHLPPNLKVVHAQVKGKLKWRAEVRRVWRGTWQEAFPAVVEPQNCPPLLWILDFERVTAGDNARSWIVGHAYR